MKNKIIVFVFLALSFNLAGCAGSPVAIARSTHADIVKMSDNQLIRYWRSRNAKKFESEIKRRKLFTPKDWKNIKNHNISIGMSKKAVFASFGSNFREFKYITKNENLTAWRFSSAAVIFGRNNRVIQMMQL